MQVVQALNFQLQLRLYHEVAVPASGQQQYEYVNCHVRTGILNGIGGHQELAAQERASSS
jgi:aldoxime dehydratase